MERVLRKPTAFVLTLSLVFGMFLVPSFADSDPLYSEASIANGIDTGFEKQGEIAEVKAQSYDDARTLNSDSHSGRFSLKIGKSELTDSVFCHIIDSSIDLSKYNQVSMWVKPKGYNIPFTLHTLIDSERTTIGSIEVADLKADVWQQVSFDLSSVSFAAIQGLHTYAYNNKSLLIDDISFSKSFTTTETWDLNADGPSNTLPTEMLYQENVGVTLKTSTTDSALYQPGAKVASIENQILGEITNIHIDSNMLSSNSALVSTGSSYYWDGITASNSAFYVTSKDLRMVYYYNNTTKYVEVKDQLINSVRQIYYGPIKMMRTSDDGSSLTLITSDSSLYLITNTAITNPTNFNQKSKNLTNGAISSVIFNGNDLYFVKDDILYVVQKENNYLPVKISDFSCYYDLYNPDPSNASITSNNTYRFYYYKQDVAENNKYYWRIKCHDNFLETSPDRTILNLQIARVLYGLDYYKIVKSNNTGSMVLYKYEEGTGVYYLIVNADTSSPTILTLNAIADPAFIGDEFFYEVGSNICRVTNTGGQTTLSSLNYSLDVNYNSGNLVYVKDYSNVYLIDKSFDYDKELLYQFSTSASISSKPASNSAIVKTMFSKLPNQIIAQMENGDIYSIDTRTKTSRLIISKMVLHVVLSDGKLLLSDMADTARFLIYDPAANSKEVFRLDNRSTGPAFTVQFNEDSKTVYYLNNENKMQVLPLTGAETKDRYAFMLDNDNKWWVYKSNVWKNIYTGSDCPSLELMDNTGMTAEEVNAITEKEFLKLPGNVKPDTLRIAVYFNSHNPYATPVLKSISVSTKDTEADLDSKTAYGTRIKEYNKADFRDISAIHVTENKDSSDEIFYFLVADDTPYSIRNGEECDIDQSVDELFGNVKDNYMDIMTYGMSAKELADFPADSLKQILITDNEAETFGIVAVIKTISKDTKEVKLDYALESLQKRFDDTVTTVTITLTDDTLVQYTTGEVTKEEIEKFTDWVMDRKYNRGPVFFTFHVGDQYKIINYYMIKMFSVE